LASFWPGYKSPVDIADTACLQQTNH
jgi:hypothetical protein